MKFLVTDLNIGFVKPGKVEHIEFPYEGDVKFTKAESPCGCSLPYFDEDKKVIIVRYTPNSMPEHLKAQGKTQLTVKKQVTVFWIDEQGIEQSQILSFTGTVRL